MCLHRVRVVRGGAVGDRFAGPGAAAEAALLAVTGPDGVDHPAVEEGIERDEAVRVEIAHRTAGRRLPQGAGLVAPVARGPPRRHPPGPDPSPAPGPQDRPSRRVGLSGGDRTVMMRWPDPCPGRPEAVDVNRSHSHQKRRLQLVHGLQLSSSHTRDLRPDRRHRHRTANGLFALSLARAGDESPTLLLKIHLSFGEWLRNGQSGQPPTGTIRSCRPDPPPDVGRPRSRAR